MKQLTIATESIAFQTGVFFKDLTLLVQDLRESAKKEEDLGKFLVRVDQCIYKHTGINTSSKLLEDWENALVLIPAMSRGNVLHNDNFNKLLSKYFDPDNLSFYNLEKKGWIDPASSRVGGALSEIVHKVFIGDTFLLDKKFSAEEAAAVILHEVGHAYTFLQFMVDTVVTNSVLQRTYQELTNGNVDKQVKVILTKAASDMEMKNCDWLQAVEDSTSKEAAFRLLVSAVQIEPRQMDNKRYFSMDACEELADIFAARHGAGRAIVTLRSKFNYQSSSYPLLQSVALGALGVLMVTCAPALVGIGIFFAFFGAVAAASTVSMAASESDISNFQHLAAKMRNQFVERLKQSGLPKEDVIDAIQSIELTDKLIQGVKSHGDDRYWVVKFVDMFRRGKMDAKASREYTDQLERLATNDLFVRAAQLGQRA